MNANFPTCTAGFGCETFADNDSVCTGCIARRAAAIDLQYNETLTDRNSVRIENTALEMNLVEATENGAWFHTRSGGMAFLGQGEIERIAELVASLAAAKEARTRRAAGRVGPGRPAPRRRAGTREVPGTTFAGRSQAGL